MKTVKLKFLGFWQPFEPEDNMFYNILKKHFIVELSDNPDFLICSPLCQPFEYARYDCVRILFTGEFLSPDFTAFDYTIDYDELTFRDRHLRYPLYLYEKCGPYVPPARLTWEQAQKEVEGKHYFCNFIFGHGAATGMRERILELLSQYKRVDCAGTYLNNMPNGYTVAFGPEKMAFVRQSKFTIAFESVNYPGYVAEKITNAFENHSIPIYYGNPSIATEFNTDAFINCHDYGSLKEAVERVIELDQNDDLYLKMLTAPIFVDNTYPLEKYAELEAFLVHIFSQPREEAYRRMRFYRSQAYETNLNTASYMLESRPVQILNAALRRLRRKG